MPRPLTKNMHPTVGGVPGQGPVPCPQCKVKIHVVGGVAQAHIKHMRCSCHTTVSRHTSASHHMYLRQGASVRFSANSPSTMYSSETGQGGEQGVRCRWGPHAVKEGDSPTKPQHPTAGGGNTNSNPNPNQKYPKMANIGPAAEDTLDEQEGNCGRRKGRKAIPEPQKLFLKNLRP